jgi:ABC-2 type transport system ATP-binding protein
MDEAERCHSLVYIAYGNLLARGTVGEVIAKQQLITWSVEGNNLYSLAAALRNDPLVEQAVVFGSTLHVSGRDRGSLERLASGWVAQGYRVSEIRPGLEDVFISLLDRHASA